jgi:predicted O-methyltransferase YrrM
MPIDSELLNEVQDVRHRLAEAGAAQMRCEGDFARVALPLGDGDVLRDLLLADRARSVVEIGLAYGSSALAIAEALLTVGTDGAQHVIIDAYQDRFHNVGWSVLVDCGLTEVCVLLRERSQFALPRLVTDGVVVDAAFVDGSHIFHNVFVDLFFLRELVRPRGLVILDDCQWPSVATAVRYFERNAGWHQEATDRNSRLRAYRLPDHLVEPNFKDFMPFGLDAPTEPAA